MKNETGLTGFLYNIPNRLNTRITNTHHGFLLFTAYELRLTKIGC